jgi:hypothetical protein
MAAKRFRAIVCEGPDDLAAIRALLEEDGCRKKPQLSGPAAASRAQHFEIGDLEIQLESRNGKSGLADLAIDLAQGGAIGRPDMILVSFDPDGDPPGREFAFFEKAFGKHTGTRGKVGQLDRNPAGARAFKMDRREVVLLPAPWRSTAIERFAGLPDEHCLECVLIDGILQAGVPEPVTRWAKDATTLLCALVPKHGYKRAFRLWNAALHPDAESFAAKLLQADEHKHACLKALRSTPAATALSVLLGA